jgi:hypothetical protein
MPFQIEPVLPTEQNALRQYLMAVFQAASDAPFLDPDLLSWKYFEPRSDWSGPRSIALKRGAQIVAHGGIFPVTFMTEGREVTAIHLIDWAASPGVPGAGVLLLRKLAPQTDIFLAIGGSSQTREILPKIGFKYSSDLQIYARVVRPWKQFRGCAFEDWKAPVRFMRNLLWSLPSLPSVPKEWSVKRVERFDESLLSMLTTRPRTEFTPCKRTVGMLNYMLDCPGTVFSAYLLMKGTELQGYFMLSLVRGQCRVADVLLNSDAQQDWHAAYSIATRTAAENPETCEVEAVSSVALVRDAIVRNGFHLRECDPIFIRDAKGLLAQAPPLHLNLIDGEGAFLSDPTHPFLTC